MDEDKLTITDSRTGLTYTLPITESSIRALELRPIRRDPDEFGMLSYDPGYTNTASCTSRIAYIDGSRGILRYRGYPIEKLAENCTYTEVAYLLLHGDLPTRQELEAWDQELAEHFGVHENVRQLINGFLDGAHPMGVLVSAVAALATFYPDAKAVESRSNRYLQQVRLVSKVSTVAAYVYRKSQGYPYPNPNSTLSYTENFVHMLWDGTFKQPRPEDSKVLARALDTLFILHAEHEQNCSTSTMRQVGSANANPYVGVAAAASALSGPLHGGANEAVLGMLDTIGSIENVPDFMRQVKAGECRLMGFGHRVYKNYDPRARIVKKVAGEVFQVTGRNPRIDLAMELERIALEDDYFVKRRLYPNIDFYTGIIYQAMGIQPEMFTVLFATARVAGWLAHWEELMSDPEKRIARPRQIYQGPEERDFIPLDERPGKARGGGI